MMTGWFRAPDEASSSRPGPALHQIVKSKNPVAGAISGWKP
jgi:hypothetical protein